MLLELNVKDIALIRKASVEFDRGLNILTGETGTGKSVIIDSAMLALGAKIRGDIIRRGAEYGYIELIFSVEDEQRKERLRELSVEPDENGQLIISRKIMPGRSVSRINDETVTLGKLSEVTSMLIDIYGQNEFHTLMDRRKHLEILDSYLGEKISGELETVKNAYHRFREAAEHMNAFSMDEKERLRETDLLTYEMNEIDEANLKEGEEEELARTFKRLNNAKNILEDIAGAHRILEEADLEHAAADISHAMRYDGALDEIYREILDAQEILNTAEKDLSAYAESLEVDDAQLSGIEHRLDLIRGLEAKYGRSVEDIRAYRSRIDDRFRELQNYETDKAQAEKELEEAKKKLEGCCAKLSTKRKAGAKDLSAAITAELKELGFSKAEISMDFKAKKPSEDGADDAGFLAALNPGEALKPLADVASGGELSRVMLAVKTILAKADDMPTLIFDEIDTGISGRTAQKVAEKMDAIAAGHQVICVSHLPQIAAMADTHFVIRKEEIDGRNVTEITRLDRNGATDELARLLGGSELTKAVYENAAEMKTLAEAAKQKRRSE